MIDKSIQAYVNLLGKLGVIKSGLLLTLLITLVVAGLNWIIGLVITLVVPAIAEILLMLCSTIIIFFAIVYFSESILRLAGAKNRVLTTIPLSKNQLPHHYLKSHQKLERHIYRLNQELDDRRRVELFLHSVVESLQAEIAQTKQNEQMLNQQSSFFRSFLDASPDLLFYKNEDEKFLGCNRAVELLLGKSEQQLMGKTPQAIYPPEIAQKVIETDERVLQHNISISYEQWFVYPDGRRACFELRKVPFYDKNGKRQGLIGFGRDITERKRYQEALENVSRDKTAFISTISHELRTPLNGIVGLSRILLDMPLAAEQFSYLKTIYVSAITLGHIFNDIIEMDRFERQNIQLNRQATDLFSFLNDFENIAGLLVQPKGLKYVLSIEETLPHTVMIDDTRVRQILWNLISNAVKFTAQGSITTTISYRIAEQKLCFSVQDTGIGIDSKEQNKIFGMYYQVLDQHTEVASIGTGIGLAVSKRLAELMQGDITVYSEAGKGACFTVNILAPIVDENVDTALSGSDEYPQLTLLLVEDIELNILVAKKLLEHLGHQVDVAMTGQEALQKFLPEKYDLVLLDIRLPDITGLEVAQKIRSLFKLTHTKLVTLSANVLNKTDQHVNPQIDYALNKPLSVREFNAMLAHLGYRKKPTAADTLPPPMADNDKLDFSILTEYQAIVTMEAMLQSIRLLSAIMPNYLQELNAGFSSNDCQNTALCAHKIKSAVGVLGLKRLQTLAHQIEISALSGSLEKEVNLWLKGLNSQWQEDIACLLDWLKAPEKK